MRRIAYVNISTLIAPRDFDLIVTACARYLEELVRPRWDLGAIAVDVFASEAAIPPGYERIVGADDSDQLGAAGYHTKLNGVPAGKFFARDVLLAGGTILGRNGVSCDASHETGEQAADPDVNLYADDGAGRLWAREIGDPFQNESFAINVNGVDVWLSNFAFPAWFDAYGSPGAQTNHMNTAAPPFVLGDGYAVTKIGSNVEVLPVGTQLAAKKLDDASRFAKRLRHLERRST